jgi:ferredoxin
MHRPASQVAHELAACIRCNECLTACPALATSITIETLNRQTLDGPVSPQVVRFAQSCYQCGACVPVCPVGLHRDAMMMWLKIRLLRGNLANNDTLLEDDSYGDPDEEERYQTRNRANAYTRQSWAARGWYEDFED